jgi:hypothetical protein
MSIEVLEEYPDKVLINAVFQRGTSCHSDRNDEARQDGTKASLAEHAVDAEFNKNL